MKINFLEKYAVDGVHYDSNHELDTVINSINLNSVSDYDSNEISRRSDLQPHHIDTLINSYDSYTRMNIADHPNLQERHINKLVTDPTLRIRETLARNKHIKLNPLHIDRLMQSDSIFLYKGLAQRDDLDDYQKRCVNEFLNKQ